MDTNGFGDLKGKVCVLTGGGGVIGTSMARALASAGIRTAVLDIRKENADATAQAVGRDCSADVIGVQADVLDRESLLRAKDRVNKELGQISLLINGAGGNSPKATTQVEQMDPGLIGELAKTFYGLDTEGFDWVFNLNFKGTVLPTMVLSTDMLSLGKGAIVNISSMNSLRPLTKIPAYSAAKASINNFTQWLSVHLAKVNIRVNAIAPGFFLTDQNRFLLTDKDTGGLTPRGEKIIAGTPMGRFGEVEELNGTLLYLLSEVSRFVTGVVVPVDGGFSAYGGV